MGGRKSQVSPRSVQLTPRLTVDVRKERPQMSPAINMLSKGQIALFCWANQTLGCAGEGLAAAQTPVLSHIPRPPLHCVSSFGLKSILRPPSHWSWETAESRIFTCLSSDLEHSCHLSLSPLDPSSCQGIPLLSFFLFFLWTILKVFIELIAILLLGWFFFFFLMFWVLGPKPCEILAP